MGLKILYWLNFAVGGDGGGNLLARDFFGPDRSHSTAHLPAGKEQERNNSSCRDQQQVISLQETVFLFPHHLKKDFFSINNRVATGAQIPVPALCVAGNICANL